MPDSGELTLMYDDYVTGWAAMLARSMTRLRDAEPGKRERLISSYRAAALHLVTLLDNDPCEIPGIRRTPLTGVSDADIWQQLED
ncbi:hypothetical protein [Streptomyces sp. NPDC003401]